MKRMQTEEGFSLRTQRKALKMLRRGDSEGEAGTVRGEAWQRRGLAGRGEPRQVQGRAKTKQAQENARQSTEIRWLGKPKWKSCAYSVRKGRWTGK